MKFLQLWPLVVSLAVLQSLELQAQDDYKLVIEEISEAVRSIAEQASVNAENVCESLETCTAETCLRRPCWPLGKYEIESLTCVNVERQDSSCSTSCSSSIHVSMSKSYIRLPPGVRENNEDLQMSICSQKSLSNKLKEVWQSRRNKEYQGWVYFGAAEGFMYIYPGRDYADNSRCTEYDPRKRPWYLNSHAVVKAVQILVDTSESMNNEVQGAVTDTCLQVSQKMVSELLDTFTNEDRVAVSDLAGRLIANASIEGTLDGTSSRSNAVKETQKSVSELVVQDQKADFKTALNKTLEFYHGFSDLKVRVLIIFSDGEFVRNLNMTDLTPVFTQLREANVTVFFCKMRQSASSNGDSMEELRSSLSATLEVVNHGENPLYQLQRYFNHLALLRFEDVKRTPTWLAFQDSSGFGNVTAAAFPAFDRNNRLIGVASFNLIANRLLKEVGSNVLQDPAYSPNPSHLQNVIAPELKPATAPNCSKHKITPVCPGQDFKTQILDFICCGNCSGADVSRSSKSRSGPVVIIGVGSAAAGAFVILFVFTVSFLAYRRYITKKSSADSDRENELSLSKDWIMPVQLTEPRFSSPTN